MKKFTLALIGLCFAASTAIAQKETVRYPDLAKEIVKMRDEDQKLRHKWADMYRKGKTDSKKFKELTDQAIAIDRANTLRMREIVNEYGWPTYALVGKGPSNSAWLIVQHADRNPLFQAKCLKLLKDALKDDQINPSNYAYLYDRVRVSRGEKQLYATQSWTNNGLTDGTFYPLEDESNVQVNREKMGVAQSVVDYASSMGFEYAIPSSGEAKERAAALKKSYETNLITANEAMENQEYSKAADHFLILTQSYGHVSTTDFVMAAKALSLADHAETSQAFTFLTRAIARGWDGFEKAQSDPAFENMRKFSESRWADLSQIAADVSLDL